MVYLALALAALIGITLGLLGGGGSILTVPILTYLVGMPPQQAVASSLFIVGTTSLVSTLGHARQGHVRWDMGALFGLAGMVGAFVGGLIGSFIPGALLMIAFAVIMLGSAWSMIREGREPRPVDKLHWPTILAGGVGVGLITGLVGAGGGFLIVPTLVALAGLPMVMAVGTSLLVITMNSVSGLAGHLVHLDIDWPITLAFTAIAVTTSFVGLWLAPRIPEKTLRKMFGYFVLAMGALVLGLEIYSLTV